MNLREMMVLEVPIIAAVIGEGGSGGALGIGVADRVLILENAYYSVISPEGCAAILWKDRSAAAKAAEALKITARHLLELGLVDEIVPEPLGGAHTDPRRGADSARAPAQAPDGTPGLPPPPIASNSATPSSGRSATSARRSPCRRRNRGPECPAAAGPGLRDEPCSIR